MTSSVNGACPLNLNPPAIGKERENLLVTQRQVRPDWFHHVTLYAAFIMLNLKLY